MNIQSNVNQGLSVASMLMTMNPALRQKAEKRSELKDLGRREKVLSKQYKIAAGTTRDVEPGEKVSEDLKADEFGGSVFTKPPDVELAQTIENQIADIAEQRFDLKPTSETYSEALGAKYGEVPSNLSTEKSQISQFKANLAAAAKKAEDNLKAKQTEKRQGRRNFKDYISSEPTSLGGSVGELDPKIQQFIAQSYSKADKKKIMDRKDKENEQK